MNGQLKLLHYINDEPKIQDMLQNFLDDNKKTEVNLFRNKLMDLVVKLNWEFSVPRNSVLLFCSLDKYCCSKISSDSQISLYVNVGNGISYPIKGSNIGLQYKENPNKIHSYLIEHLNLFPKTLRDKIKFEDDQITKKSCFLLIKNQLEYKVFLNQLSSEFSEKNLNLILKSFYEKPNQVEKMASYFFFYKAIHEKYPQVVKTKKFQNVAILCMGYIIYQYNSRFLGVLDSNDNLEQLKIFSHFLKDTNTRKDFFNKIKNENIASNTLLFTFKITDTDEEKEIVKNKIGQILTEDTDSDTLKFSQCTDKMKNDMINESIRQFNVKYGFYDFVN